MKTRIERIFAPFMALVIATLVASPAFADADHGKKKPDPMPNVQSETGMRDKGETKVGLIFPMMNPADGRKLFANKGCVVCHSVNGVGGQDASPLDARSMDQFMNPFEFSAKMWRGAEAMIALQRDELGEQIELTGQELADIIAFTHSAAEQKKFSERDIPESIEKLMHHGSKEKKDGHDDGKKKD